MVDQPVSKVVNVKIMEKKTGEVFDDEFATDNGFIEEITEIFDEEYGNEKYTLMHIDRGKNPYNEPDADKEAPTN